MAHNSSTEGQERTLNIDQLSLNSDFAPDLIDSPLEYHQGTVSRSRLHRISLQPKSPPSSPAPEIHRSRPHSMQASPRKLSTNADKAVRIAKSEKSSLGGLVKTRRRTPEPTTIDKNERILEDSSRVGQPIVNMSPMTDFFSPEVFQIVLHNPTTAHRFLRFCQSRACGENLEFLQRISAYHRLLDDMATALGAIHADFIALGAPKQLNLPTDLGKNVSNTLKEATYKTLPGLESIFAGAQGHVEQLLASDVYPRFVKHQITASATMSMASHRELYGGLGDCFCMTDPQVADNPIVFASDGFISVTGYSRKDIIPRNCRFLQGKQTDPKSTSRLRASIHACEETVELLLNYRKNGDPFWNLLYVAPLLDERGEVSYYLGGQIDCSTTIHSCTDVLKVLSVNDDELDLQDQEVRSQPSSVKRTDGTSGERTKSSFFKNRRKFKVNLPNSEQKEAIRVRDQAGMEGELLNRVGNMNFKTQVEAFYTAYSKYLVLHYNGPEQLLTVQHFSPGMIDMLHLNMPNGSIVPIYNREIFSVLGEHSASGSSSSTAKSLKRSIHASLKSGRAVSVEIGLMTGFAEKKGSSWFGSSSGGVVGSRDGSGGVLRKVEERYVTHWTPLKGESGSVKKVVLTIVPKM